MIVKEEDGTIRPLSKEEQNNLTDKELKELREGRTVQLNDSSLYNVKEINE